MKIVFFGPGYSIWKSLFFELTKIDSGVEYCDYYNKENSAIKRILMSQKVNKITPHFIKRIIFRHILKYEFLKHTNRNEQILFAMTNGYELWADIEKFNILMNFIKHEFPNSKFAIHLMESLQSLKGTSTLNKVLDTIDRFDLALTFNRYDSKEFGIEYYPPVSEKMCVVPTGHGEQSDLFYAGGVGNNRVELALSVFKKASDMGKKCIFFLAAKIKEPSFLKFDDKSDCYSYKNSKLYLKYIPYSTCLSYIKKTKVQLEIVLPVGLASCTVRPSQCMNYKIKLLTNCPTAIYEPYYNPNNVSVYTDETDIDFDFFKTDFLGDNHDYSAPKLIEYMKNRLYED